MTTRDERQMPKWPTIEPECAGKSFRQQVEEWNEVTGAMNSYYANECCYFADDADQMVAAWEARCRLAVALLIEGIGEEPWDDAECDVFTAKVREALADILPLPK